MLQRSRRTKGPIHCLVFQGLLIVSIVLGSIALSSVKGSTHSTDRPVVQFANSPLSLRINKVDNTRSDTTKCSSHSESPLTAEPAEIGTVFRRTKNGWEDSSKWRYEIQIGNANEGLIHPVVWGGMIVGLVLIAFIGLSRPAEVDDVFAELDAWLANLSSKTNSVSAPISIDEHQETGSR